MSVPPPSRRFDEELARMDPALRADLCVAVENLGMNSTQQMCELLAVAARLGEISLREPPVQ